MVWLILPVGGLLAAGAVWLNMSVGQITLAGIGFGCLVYAWLVWRHGIIAYSHQSGIDPESGEVAPPTTTVRRSPLPPGVLAPILTVAAAIIFVASTPTGAGDILYGPVFAVIAGYEFAQATWGWFMTGVLIVALVSAVITGVVRRDAELACGGLFAAAFFSCAFGLAYLFYRSSDNEEYRSDWEKGFEPIRLVMGLFD
jgi:hypothetical protein